MASTLRRCCSPKISIPSVTSVRTVNTNRSSKQLGRVDDVRRHRHDGYHIPRRAIRAPKLISSSCHADTNPSQHALPNGCPHDRQNNWFVGRMGSWPASLHGSNCRRERIRWIEAIQPTGARFEANVATFSSVGRQVGRDHRSPNCCDRKRCYCLDHSKAFRFWYRTICYQRRQIHHRIYRGVCGHLHGYRHIFPWSRRHGNLSYWKTMPSPISQ